MRKIVLILCVAIGFCGCNLSGGKPIASDISNPQGGNLSSPGPVQSEGSEKSSISSSENLLPPQISAPINSSKTEFTSAESSSEEQAPPSESTDIQSTESVRPEPPHIVSENVCTMSIECTTVFNNLNALEKGKEEILPPDGVIFAAASVEFSEGESVFDLLKRVCKNNKIHMESSWTPMYNSAYIEGINNLYEFDCGSGSGWMYRVNGVYPNYGCSRYKLKRGDFVEWRYTCDLGKDIGGDVLGG